MYKAKQRMKTLLLACFAALVSMLLAVALWVAPTSKIDASAAMTGEGNFVKVTVAPDDWSGDYLIVYEAGNVAFDGSLTTLDAANNNVAVTITDGSIDGTEAMKAIAFTIEKSGSNYTIKSAKGYYIGNTANSNKLNSSTSTKYTNTISLNNDGSVHIVGSGSSVLRYNANNNNYRFRYFKSSTYTDQKAIALYKWVEEASSEPDTPACEHTNTTSTTVDATCTAAGSITVTCDDCGETVSTTEIPATGHVNTTTTTVAATCTTAGSTTVTCDDCGAKVSEAEIPALGHNFAEPTYERNGDEHTATGICKTCGETTSETENCTLSYENVSNGDKTHDMTSTCSVCNKSATETVDCTFEKTLNETTYTYTCQYCDYFYEEAATTYTVTFAVPNEVASIASVEVVEGYTTKLSPAEDYQKYTFVGWIEEKLDEDTTTAPDYFKAGDEYTVNADVTLYALYSYSDGEAEETWNLVTDAATLAVGKEIVIVASDSDYALGTYQKSNNREAVAITKNDNGTISWTTTVQIITLEAGTVANTFAFNVGNGYLYAASSSSNHLKTQTENNANGSWKIEITAEGVATITAPNSSNRSLWRYNPNNGTPIFNCYSNTSTTGTLVSIYMKSGGAITYYATPIIEEGGHEHAYDEGVVTPPTCTEEGYTTYTCGCGDTYKDNYVDATGHSYGEEITAAATCTEAGIKTFTCSVCADSYTEAISALGHSFTDGKCANCGISQPINATLTFDDTSKRTSLTDDRQVWTENGITVTNNRGSGNNIGDYSNPVRFYKSSTVTIEWAGMKVIVLNSASGEHATNLELSLTEGTVTKNGTVFTIVLDESVNSYTFTCAGQVRLNSISVYSKEANIDSASLTIGKDITMNYYVTMPDALAGAQMYFTVEGATSPIDPVNGKLVDGRYVFSLDLPPHFMANNISAELKLGDAVLAIKAEYSVKEYAQNQLNNIADGKQADANGTLKQLLTDLLYYGDAAYNYFYEKTNETPATSDVENLGAASESTPDTTDFTLTKNGEITSYPAYFLGAGVYFDNVNQIYVKINTTENVTLTINGVEAEITGNMIYTDGILATGFDVPYEFKLYHNDVLMQTLTYSVNAYAYAKQGDATMGELALALYRYGVSAKAYAGA